MSNKSLTTPTLPLSNADIQRLLKQARTERSKALVLLVKSSWKEMQSALHRMTHRSQKLSVGH